MMNTASLLSRIQCDRTQPVKPGFDDDGRDRWLTTLEKLEKEVRAVGLEEERILKDRDLAPEGQRKKLVALGARVVEDLAWLGRVLKQADEAYDRLTKLMFDPITKRPTGDPTVIFLREKEIRDSIRSFDENQRNAHFLKALERDDPETARAMLDAPGGAMVSEEMRHRGEESYAKYKNPEGYRKMDAVAYLREHLESLAEQTAMWLISLGATREAVGKAVKEAYEG